MSKWFYVVLLLFGILISSFSQVLLKKSAKKKYDSWIKEYLNIYVIIAYGLFFLTTVISVLAYRYLPLSLGQVLETSGYIYISVLGFIFFREKITTKKVIAITLIFFGVFISTYFG